MKKDNAENESPSKLAIPWKGNLRRVSDIDIVMLPEYQWKWYSSKKNLWRSTTVTQVSSKGHALGLLDLIRFRDSRKFLIWTRRIRRTFQSSVEYLTFLSLIFRRRGKNEQFPEDSTILKFQDINVIFLPTSSPLTLLCTQHLQGLQEKRCDKKAREKNPLPELRLSCFGMQESPPRRLLRICSCLSSVRSLAACQAGWRTLCPAHALTHEPS